MPRSRMLWRRSRPPYTSSPATKPARMPRSCACWSRSPASSGFVANMTSSGTPASSRRSSSAAQSAGRYRARPIRACPAGAATVRVTATWHKAIPPTVPLYWRAAPAQSVGGLLVGGLVHDQHHVTAVLVLACGKMTGGPVRGGIEHPLLIDAGAGQQVLHPVRARVPGGLGHRPAVVILQLASAGRSPCHGRSGGSPAGRSTARPAPSGHRAGPHARHGLPWQQRLPC